jgi:iron complex outermembrane receptor protein
MPIRTTQRPWPAATRLAASVAPAVLALLYAATLSRSARADDAAPAFDLAPVVVSATRVREASADLPVSIDLVNRQQISEGQQQVNLSEPLIGVPGVNAQNRQNYAQDLQISVRGFGARSSFGVRGVRLYADDIPGTMPDGQGQFSNFDLGSADRIEVLRGPFSALYGNSSGGVISVYTEDAPPGQRVDASAEYGSYDTQRYAVKELLGLADGFNLVADGYHFSTDGYRAHSAAQRDVFNAKAVWQLEDASRLTLIANAVDLPDADDPLGLTRAQLDSNREQAGTGALAYNTRKSVQQQQTGAHYERTLGPNDELSALVYGGDRDTTQYQAIPKANEGAPTNPGGVIVLNNDYVGLDVHLTDQRRVAETSLQSSVGVAYDYLDDGRRGYLNFIGDQLGVKGALRRDENDTVYDIDEYLQLQWDPAARWRLTAGVRNSAVPVSSDNHLAAPGTPTESGVRYHSTNPVAGLTFRALQDLDLYASYGKGFETPTLDELAVEANSAGRSVYQNIPATQRRGAEFELQGDWGYGFSSQMSYTYIQALTLQAYGTCILVPCVPLEVAAGARVPAVPANALYAATTWRRAPGDLWVTIEAVARGQIYANDLDTQAAAGYWLANLRIGTRQQGATWQFSESLRMDNLTNRSYVGSVIVNETNARYFEPEPGRTVYLMLSASYR